MRILGDDRDPVTENFSSSTKNTVKGKYWPHVGVDSEANDWAKVFE